MLHEFMQHWDLKYIVNWALHVPEQCIAQRVSSLRETNIGIRSSTPLIPNFGNCPSMRSSGLCVSLRNGLWRRDSITLHFEKASKNSSERTASSSSMMLLCRLGFLMNARTAFSLRHRL